VPLVVVRHGLTSLLLTPCWRETDSNLRSPVRERFSTLPRLSSPSRCRERDPSFESLFLHRRVSLREF
jgi:hypothetical protein